jgi:hypothetical protein
MCGNEHQFAAFAGSFATSACFLPEKLPNIKVLKGVMADRSKFK